MKIIKYIYYKKVNIGTDEEPRWNEYSNNIMMPWSESAEEIAKIEAKDGEYTIEEVSDVETPITTDDVLNTLLGVAE